MAPGQTIRRSEDGIRSPNPVNYSKMRGLWWKLLTGIWMCLGILGAFLYVGPAQGFTMGGQGAKVIFFHVPCAWLASLAYVVGAWYAITVLVYQRRQEWTTSQDRDAKCAAAMELGLLFAFLATVTGSIFAHNEWGLYWNWDPRETTILIILLIFAAYMVLRGMISEPRARARLCSAYTLVASVTGLFLIWVLPRLLLTLHPNSAVVGGGLSPNYRMVLYGFFLPSFVALFVWMIQLRVRLMKLEARRAEA